MLDPLGLLVALDRVEPGERFAQLMIDDLFMIDIDLMKDGLVEGPPLLVVAAPAERLRIC